MKTAQEIYKKYFIDKHLERRDLFKAFTEQFGIGNTLYPGSFTHITASFFIPEVVYVDTDKQAIRFFKDTQAVQGMIDANKIYPQAARFSFLAEDFRSHLDLIDENFDLMFSQYSGIISQYCKRYLKIGGFLLTNNSHADAGVAILDKDYELIAVTHEQQGRTVISDKDLQAYCKPKKAEKHSIESLMKLGKGIKYEQSADNYIFKRIK